MALNSAGEASSQCTLTIEPKPVEETPQEPSGSAPKFTKLLTDVLVAEDDKVVFEGWLLATFLHSILHSNTFSSNSGNVTGEPKPELKWLLNNIPITDTAHFQTTQDEEGNFKLEIQNVKAEDKGVYTLKASNPAGDAKCFAQLIVKSSKLAETAKPYEEIKSAPVFKELFHDKVAFADTPTKFECIVVGKPKPKVKWLFNGNPISGEGFLISTSGDRQVLSIPELKPEHQGTITCAAENEAGKASCAATLTVQSSSEIALPEQVIPSLSDATLKHVETSYSVNKEVVTQSSTMSSSKIISSSTGVSEPHVEEHKTVSQETQSFRRSNQDAPQVQKTQKIEEYHKIGKEPPVITEKTYIYGDQADSTTNIQKSLEQEKQIVTKPFRITRPPKWITPVIGKIIDQDVDVVLEGILDGQPLPKVTWTKDGKELQESDRIKIHYSLNKATVEIKKCTAADSGRYSCTATNDGGTAISTADLVVKSMSKNKNKQSKLIQFSCRDYIPASVWETASSPSYQEERKDYNGG